MVQGRGVGQRGNPTGHLGRRGKREGLLAATREQIGEHRLGGLLEAALALGVFWVHPEPLLELYLGLPRVPQAHQRETPPRKRFDVDGRHGDRVAVAMKAFVSERLASHGVPECLLEEPEVEIRRGSVAVAHVQVLVHQVVIPELAEDLGESGDAAEIVALLEEGDGLGVELRDCAFFEVRIGREHLVAQADDHQPGAGLTLLLFLALDVLERFGMVIVVGVLLVRLYPTRRFVLDGLVVVVVVIRLVLARHLDGPRVVRGEALDVVHVFEIFALVPGIGNLGLVG